MEVEKINRKIGININAEKIVDLLSAMCLESIVDDSEFVKVTVPPTRAGKLRHLNFWVLSFTVKRLLQRLIIPCIMNQTLNHY